MNKVSGLKMFVSMEVHFVMVSDLEVFISNYLAVWVAIGFMCKLPVYIF